MGAGPLTIGSNGCYLTSDAMLMDWAGHSIDPPGLNSYYVDHGVYVSGDCLYDSALHDAFPDLWALEEVYHCESFPCDQAKLDNDDPNLYVVVEIVGPAGLTHFSPVTRWREWVIADAWDGQERSIGQRGAAWGWGGDSAALVGKVMRYRFIGGAAPSPVPAPAAGTFTGVTCPAGVHVRLLPGGDQAIVSQPGTNPDVVDGGVTLTFDGWCHHAAHGGADQVPADYWTNQPDDRWFRVQGSGHWIASSGINGNPPAGLAPLPDLAGSPPPLQLPSPALQGPPAMPPFLNALATWKGPIPNMTPNRRDRADGTGWDHPGDPASPLTGPSYDLARGCWLVLHHMDSSGPSADADFQRAASQHSAHYGILQSGERWQWVDEADASWGAGNYGVNVRSINIEHEDFGLDAYTLVQLQASAELLADISVRRGVPLVRGSVRDGRFGVIGHNEVPDGHNPSANYATACPGKLPIDQILELARALVEPAQPGPAVVLPGPVPADPAPAPTARPWWRLLLDLLLSVFRRRR